MPPRKQGDYGYLLHIIRSMKRTGKAACILPHGVLFRGNAEAAIRDELDRISHALTGRIRELAERYETPMPRMMGRVAELESTVNGHLEKMGFAWD